MKSKSCRNLFVRLAHKMANDFIALNFFEITLAYFFSMLLFDPPKNIKYIMFSGMKKKHIEELGQVPKELVKTKREKNYLNKFNPANPSFLCYH